MTVGANSRHSARSSARRRARQGRHSRRKKYRAQWFGVTALAVLAIVVFAHPDPGNRSDLAVSAGRAEVGTTPVAEPTPSQPTFPQRPAPTISKPMVLRQALPARPNITRSTGRLAVVAGSAKAANQAHKLTYRIEIEQGLSFSGPAVAAAVHQTLTDARGWQKTYPVNFERIDGPNPDIRIIVATPMFTDRLCKPLDTGGQVSCRVDDRVVLNAKRWAYGIDAYAGRLDLYRSYLVNHEVGHALGYGHSTCATQGTPAPVMMQQTKGLGGCKPNAWPTVRAT
jgi:hypothetical protein